MVNIHTRVMRYLGLAHIDFGCSVSYIQDILYEPMIGNRT